MLIITRCRLKRLLTVLLGMYALGLLVYMLVRTVLGDAPWLLGFLNNFTPYYFVPLPLTIPLALMLRAPRLFGWQVVALAVGLLWLTPRFTMSAAAPTAETLTVVAFNVWGDNDRTDEVFAWIRETDPDVALFQEIPPDWSENGVPQLLDTYPHQVFQPLEVSWWGEGLISKHPVIESERFLLQEEGWHVHDRAVIDWNGQPVALYNIHFFMPLGAHARFSLPFGAHFADMFSRYDDRGRNGQIDALLARLESEPHPYIVGGDFNMSDNAAKYVDLTAVMRDSWRDGARGLGPTWPSSLGRAELPWVVPPMIRIDYVFHSNDFATVEAYRGPALGSDHLPVVASLVLVP